MTIDPLSYYTLLQAYALPGLYGVNPTLLTTPSAVEIGAAGIGQAIGADQVEISALGQLAASVATFQTAMQGLETPDQVAPAQLSDSNSAVGTASALATALPGVYNVTVTSLAQAQTVESAGVADPNTTVIGSGTLTIQLGSYNSTGNTFTASATPAVSINVSNASLNQIANAINGANAGVSASVVQDGSGYHLVLTGASTGAANGFEVTVQDGDGNNTDTSGLSQLAYDPTASAGAGKNLTLTQAAQDASLSVNGVSQTSASNAVSVASGVTLDLAQPGSTTLSVEQNTAALQSAAQSFVDAYNALESSLSQATASGGALANDPAATQLQQDLVNTYLQSYSAGSFSGLAQVGINAQSDGTLSLDGSALQSAFQADPTGTVSLLNQAAQAFDSLSNGYAAPDGTIPLESQTLQQNVLDLQTIGGSFLSAAGVSQQQASQQYQAALQLGYQAQLNAGEVAMLLNLMQPQLFGAPQPFGASGSVGLPLSSGTLA
jgi:flagellar hook-associated protein 2